MAAQNPVPAVAAAPAPTTPTTPTEPPRPEPMEVETQLVPIGE